MPNGACKVKADYDADFAAIESETGSKIVRIYAAGQCNTAQEILPAAKDKGFQVLLGVWYVNTYKPLPHAITYKIGPTQKTPTKPTRPQS